MAKNTTVNDQISIEPHDIKWAIDKMKADLLKVDPSFQRNYVWLTKHQVKLIETILMGFPIPEIYLWQQETNPETGDTLHSVVDGQQRLGAVLDFINGIFPLQKKLLDKANQDAKFADKKFTQLSTSEKSRLWQYKLSIRMVGNKVSRPEIVKMFLRLNATNMSLNPQELRNAEYSGEFLQAAVEIANSEFWSKYAFFSSQDIRRMIDVQFVSSVLMFFRKGIGDDTTQENFNAIYDLYNEAYEERKDDEKLIHALMKEIEFLINGEKTVSKFLRRKTHLYTVFLCAYSAKSTKKSGFTETNREKFHNFVYTYENPTQRAKLFSRSLQVSIDKYKRLSSTGTAKKNNRFDRLRILTEIMEIN